MKFDKLITFLTKHEQSVASNSLKKLLDHDLRTKFLFKEQKKFCIQNKEVDIADLSVYQGKLSKRFLSVLK